MPAGKDVEVGLGEEPGLAEAWGDDCRAKEVPEAQEIKYGARNFVKYATMQGASHQDTRTTPSLSASG